VSTLLEALRTGQPLPDKAAAAEHYRRLAAAAVIQASAGRGAWGAYQLRGEPADHEVCTLRMQPGVCVVRYSEVDCDHDGRPVYSVDAIQLAGGVWLSHEALDEVARQVLDAALQHELRRLADEERVHGY
jgi:hypothetical protein